MPTAHARALSTRNVLEGRAHISAHIATDAACVYDFQVVRCQATLTTMDVTELPIRVIRDHELKVFCKFGNKLSAQGNNICSMEFAKLTRRFIVALRFVWIILQAHHATCLKRNASFLSGCATTVAPGAHREQSILVQRGAVRGVQWCDVRGTMVRSRGYNGTM